MLEHVVTSVKALAGRRAGRSPFCVLRLLGEPRGSLATPAPVSPSSGAPSAGGPAAPCWPLLATAPQLAAQSLCPLCPLPAPGPP